MTPRLHTVAGVQVWPGRPYRRGATDDAVGTNFACSEVAEQVDRCVFDAAGDESRIVLSDVGAAAPLRLAVFARCLLRHVNRGRSTS